MQKILITEDDPAISAPLRAFLENEGYAAVTAAGQRRAEELLDAGDVDLALVDLSLADGTGYGVCARARAAGVPVIFLTASGDEGSTVAGLEMGAEDYVAKPFRPRELVSRIRRALRSAASRSSVLKAGDVRLDPETAVVTKAGREVTLTALEYRLLLTFLSARGRVLTRTRLLEEIWDVAGDYVNDNTLTVYVKRLREKIEDDPQEPRIIRTVRGLGYRVDEAGRGEEP